MVYQARVVLAFAVLAIPVASQGADAKSGERNGKQVVEAVCQTCHGTGAHGAPKIGDRKAWAKRSSQGLSSLTEHAIKGIREMPSHGGNPDLSDLEIGRAVTYMVNQSGGKWIEPRSKTKPTAERSGEQVVRMRCVKCHEAGTGGAPKIGDQAAWAPRMSQGLDATVRSAINGHGGMPARGGMPDLTDSELRRAITYMFSKGAAPAK